MMRTNFHPTLCTGSNSNLRVGCQWHIQFKFSLWPQTTPMGNLFQVTIPFSFQTLLAVIFHILCVIWIFVPWDSAGKMQPYTLTSRSSRYAKSLILAKVAAEITHRKRREVEKKSAKRPHNTPRRFNFCIMLIVWCVIPEVLSAVPVGRSAIDTIYAGKALG